MKKRNALLLINLLVASISLAGCSVFHQPTNENPDQPEKETILFTDAEITPNILKVEVGETLQLTVTTAPSNATESGITFQSEHEGIATVDDNGVVTGVKAGTSKIIVYGAESNKMLTSKILTVTHSNPDIPLIHIDVENTIEKTEIKSTYKDYSKYSVYGDMDYCPTVGTANVLVIPIWFSDSDEFIAESNKEMVRKDIEKAYFGFNSDVGWRSVKTYYEEESNGLLHLNGTVSKLYELESSYTNFKSNTYSTISLVSTATDWFFSLPENASLSHSDFDADNNGYLDGVMLIYAAPDYSQLWDLSSDNLWAYCYWTGSQPDLSSPNPNAFFWASYDFMYSRGDYALYRTGKSLYGSGDTTLVSVDTHTFIHEMGHVFGLDDYYDYSGQYNPAGGFSMQDQNVGGHDPFSLMAYGWVKPYVVSDTAEVVIESFQKSKDLILLTPEWNDYDSPFDEYILLELFTPTGVNQFDCEHKYRGSTRGPLVTAIRMWHIDARLVCYLEDDEFITTNPIQNGSYGVITAFTNTYYSSDNPETNNRISVLGRRYANHNILQLIRNNTSETYTPTSFLNERNMFKTGKYNLRDYADQFVRGNNWEFNNEQSLDWTIDITIGRSDDDAAAIVKLTKNS